MDAAKIVMSGLLPQPSGEDQARADMYALIATLLLKPPTRALLEALASSPPLPGEAGRLPLGAAWEVLIEAADAADAGEIEDEFNALFIATGTPLLNPYGSRYLTGFMNEKPLARLRDDLAGLGLARARGACESEDHLGALCETMRILIGGTHAASARSLSAQESFFTRHIASWYARCLDDIRGAPPARFYRCVAGYAMAFLDLEREAFDIETRDADTTVPAPRIHADWSNA